MNSSMTISVRSLVIAAAVAAALLLAYLVGAVQGGTVPAAAAAPAAAPVTAAQAGADQASVGSPTIVMSGTGTATGVPDQLSFRVEIHGTATDVSTALGYANGTTRRVLTAVEDEGVADADVQTTGLSIHANYDYSDDGPAVITGYSVTQNLSVLVRSLPGAGRIISATADAGGNAIRLHDVRLQVGDTDALLAKARDAAMAEAKAKAAQYAEASGRSLGDVLLVREAGGAGRHAQVGLEAAAYATDGALRAVPIREGKAELDVSVSVVWSLV